MFELKPLPPSAVPAALEKAERYRLLNEPREAESICLDVLAVEPDNQRALVTLLLALTDQFGRQGASGKVAQARELVARLQTEHDRAYYEGIIFERRAKAALERGGPASGWMAYDDYRRAMELYERAAALASGQHDDATLRWNACARTVNRNPKVTPAPQGTTPDMLE